MAVLFAFFDGGFVAGVLVVVVVDMDTLKNLVVVVRVRGFGRIFGENLEMGFRRAISAAIIRWVFVWLKWAVRFG